MATKKTTLSDVIAGAAKVPARDLGLRSAQELAKQDAEEFYEEGQGQQRRYPLPDAESVKAAGGGAFFASLALASQHPVAGIACAGIAFSATCIAESILQQEGQK